MLAECKPGSLNGMVTIPASKSMMQRVCAAALLNGGRTTIHNPGTSQDDEAALLLVQQLGAVVLREQGKITIISSGIQPTTETLYCGESGLSARLFIPLAAICGQPLQITGSGSLLSRPFDTYANVLPNLGVQYNSSNGHLPVTIQGPLQPADIHLDGSLSSQFLSGILVAFVFSAVKPCTITVSDLQSKPYIDMTLSVLAQFGRPVVNNDYQTFYIDPANFTSKESNDITIESDWSSAAALLVGGAISGDVIADGVYEYSLQADKAVMDALYDAGVLLCFGETWAQATKPPMLKSFKFDATHAPDLFPVLAILAACCKGESNIKGVHRLIHKESNRILSISEMLTNLGVTHSVVADALHIDGQEQLKGCNINAYNDHRIVMAAAIAGLRCDGEVVIEGAGAVNKSYPDFFAHLYALGAQCTLKDQHI